MRVPLAGSRRVAVAESSMPLPGLRGLSPSHPAARQFYASTRFLQRCSANAMGSALAGRSSAAPHPGAWYTKCELALTVRPEVVRPRLM
jgi:hypothetical protein